MSSRGNFCYNFSNFGSKRDTVYQWCWHYSAALLPIQAAIKAAYNGIYRIEACRQHYPLCVPLCLWRRKGDVWGGGVSGWGVTQTETMERSHGNNTAALSQVILLTTKLCNIENSLIVHCLAGCEKYLTPLCTSLRAHNPFLVKKPHFDKIIFC